jgi:hypothetical protein
VVELGGEKGRRRLQDVLGPAQLSHLTAQGLQLLALCGAQQVLADAGVGLCPSHPLAQGLVVDAKVAGYMGDGAAGVGDHPGTAIEQLIGVFLLSWHGLGVPFFQVEILVSGSPSNLAWLRGSLPALECRERQRS